MSLSPRKAPVNQAIDDPLSQFAANSKMNNIPVPVRSISDPAVRLPQLVQHLYQPQ